MPQYLPEWKEARFRNLRRADYAKTSDPDVRYNCVAWAVARDQNRWWQPDDPDEHYWPEALPRVEDFQTYQTLFEHFGFAVCDDAQLEEGLEKIAIFVFEDGGFSHVALQLPNGRWTSKLGDWEDIEHDGPACLEGGRYGHVAKIMSRRRPPA